MEIKTLLKLIQRIKKWCQPSATETTRSNIPDMPLPTILSRGEHTLSRKMIHPLALKILTTLHRANFSAYLVGGCVRDLLLGRQPKDFDIATDALPAEVKTLFGRNARLIGRRFPLVHVHYGRDVFEVSTFRSLQPEAASTAEGMILRDNVYGTIAEDAWRRDFTVNALYYNSRDFTVTDYTGGLVDLDRRVLRMIGDPLQRYREDPVRLLRALRFAAKLDFTLDPALAAPIAQLKTLLLPISPARLFLEVEKLFASGGVKKAVALLQHYEIFPLLFPETAIALKEYPNADPFMQQALQNTDERVAEGKSTTPAFLLAVMLWFPFQKKCERLATKYALDEPLLIKTADKCLKKQSEQLTIPRFVSLRVRDIWLLQPRLELRKRPHCVAILQDRYFRAAYDFLLLRAMVDQHLQPIADWWTQWQIVSPEMQQELLSQLPKTKRPRRRKAK